MTDSDQKLDFSLPPRAAGPAPSGGRGLFFLLVLVAVLAAANLGILLMKRAPTHSAAGSVPSSSGGLSIEASRELALKLEGQGLQAVAAQAWVDYLAAAQVEAKDASAIWYRIGKLHQDAGDFDRALAAYYRCEALDPESGLKSEIGRRAQESLESMGKFAALKQELVSRVSMDGPSSDASTNDEVIAEIGPRKITRAEIDQQMEASIENQLARFAGRMPEEQRKQQKESMLKQFSTDAQRMQFLQSYVVQEILNRKARESKLIDEPTVRAQLQDMERSFLAQQMMAQEIASKINIVESDVTTYYEANKARYVEPESASISQILVAEEAAAKALAEELKEADGAAFAAKAKEVSIDEATKANGGEIAAPIQKGSPAPAGVSSALVGPVFQTDSGKLVTEPIKTEAGFHLVFVRERQAEKQKAFADVRDQVYQELHAQKEQETEQQLMNRLRDEYSVVIHQSKFKTEEEAK